MAINNPRGRPSGSNAQAQARMLGVSRMFSRCIQSYGTIWRLLSPRFASFTGACGDLAVAAAGPTMRLLTTGVLRLQEGSL